MRIHCKVVVIAVCFGVFLLLYFLGGNAADDPPLKEVVKKKEAGNSSSPSAPVIRRDVPAKLKRKPPARVAVGAGKRKDGKEGKAASRGADVNAKR